jgi:dTDP-4-amino-4,6-dideoxy-D-galactose acyltransferase
MNIQCLAWDSDFFGKKVGTIHYSSDVQLLQSLLHQASDEGYDLLYVFSDEKHLLDSYFMERHNGRLVDRKVMFSLAFDEAQNVDDCVLEYEDPFLSPELEELAYLSGKYSRFKLDKEFDLDHFKRLYKQWIQNSLTKSIADHFFVIKQDNVVVGMVTLKIQSTHGEIGLIAVSDQVQGRKYGTKLIEKCKAQLLSNNIHHLRVTTQMENESAFLFYNKCGFTVESITNIYHFWR